MTYTPTNNLLIAAAPHPASAYTPTNAALIAAAPLPSGIGPSYLYIGAIQVGGLWIGAVQPAVVSFVGEEEGHSLITVMT